jgi:hypothetical protein
MALDADPYRVLGLSRGASLDEVKRAYRRLAKANHPDAAGAGALPRFLAIQAAYERLAGGAATTPSAGRAAPAARRRSAASEPAGGAGSSGSSGSAASGASGSSRPGRTKRGGNPPGGSEAGRSGGRARAAGPEGQRAGQPGGTAGGGTSAGDGTQTDAGRGKATLGSTSYDGADAGPFEPDWAGASWYGTTSGTYWTINPKEYADPRKHGPEYQARARRAAADPAPSHPPTTEPEPEARRGAARGNAASEPARPAGRRGPAASRAQRIRDDRPAPDPMRAAIDLGRALTDPAAGGLRGRAMRAVLGWIPAALGLGWLLGELTGCGRFAATCDPAVGPLTAVGQATVLIVLLLLPEIAAVAAGAALVVLGAAVSASLVLSATGAAADEASRRTALGGLLLVAWLGGLAIALVRRARRGPRRARPVS